MEKYNCSREVHVGALIWYSSVKLVTPKSIRYDLLNGSAFVWPVHDPTMARQVLSRYLQFGTVGRVSIEG